MISVLRFAVAATAAAILSVAVTASAAPLQGGAYHIFATPAYEARTGRRPHAGLGEVEYFGGTVFSNVEVVSVMWGPDVNSTTVAEIPDFSAAIVNSTFLEQLEEYSTKHKKSVDHHKSSDQTIGLGTFYGQVQISPKDKKTTLTDKQIHKELEYQISIGALPPQGPNMLYMIYFPTDITITLDGLVSCQDFGAYHFAVSKKQTPSNIFYTVEPDCSSGFDFITYAASHEFAEATTDNIGTLGTNPKFPQAWNTSDGYEIADICEGDTGDLTDATRSYQVTQVYLDSTSNCSTGNYNSPPG